MPEPASFQEIAGVFDERVRRIVWCTVSTVDTKGRPFSRILHPVWERRHRLDRDRPRDAEDEAPRAEPDGQTPPPVGYDPGLFFRGGVTDPGYGVLRLDPIRIDLWAGKDMLEGRPATVWRAKG